MIWQVWSDNDGEGDGEGDGDCNINGWELMLASNIYIYLMHPPSDRPPPPLFNPSIMHKNSKFKT